MAQPWALSPCRTQRLSSSTAPPSWTPPSPTKSKQAQIVAKVPHRLHGRPSLSQMRRHDPTSKLATMLEKQFSSRWADLNHRCNNGDLVMFLSGRMIDIGGHMRKRRAAKAERRAARKGRVLNEEEKQRAARQLESNGGRKLMGQGVFCVMICSMPSDEEMAAAQEHIKTWWLPDPSKAAEGTSQGLSPMPSKQ